MLRKLGIALLLLIALAVAIPVGWLGSAFAYEWWNTYTHRFRLTIEVDTPDGIKSGSSVLQVSVTFKADWIPQTGGIRSSARGEAAFVDLGQGRNVIAALAFGPTASKVDLHYLAGEALGRRFPDWYREAPAWKGKTELRGDLIPTLVTFSDLNDPKTARVVQPHEFPQVFGEGVKFRGATIEMTRDAVTRGIADKLQWILTLKGYSGGQLHPDWSRPEKNLTGNHFVRGRG